MRAVKVALAAALLMGNITAPSTNEGYYEDDQDFSVASISNISGWGWGFNNAHADPRTNCVATECDTTASGDWGVTIEPYDSWDDWDPWGDQSSSDTNDDGDTGSSGGGGGSGGSSNPGADQERIKECIKECKNNVAQEVTTCKDSYMYYTTGAGVLCGRITFGLGQSFCGAAVGTLVYKAHKWCDDQGAAKVTRECK